MEETRHIGFDRPVSSQKDPFFHSLTDPRVLSVNEVYQPGHEQVGDHRKLESYRAQ